MGSSLAAFGGRPIGVGSPVGDCLTVSGFARLGARLTAVRLTGCGCTFVAVGTGATSSKATASDSPAVGGAGAARSARSRCGSTGVEAAPEGVGGAALNEIVAAVDDVAADETDAPRIHSQVTTPVTTANAAAVRKT